MGMSGSEAKQTSTPSACSRDIGMPKLGRASNIREFVKNLSNRSVFTIWGNHTGCESVT